jgi:hypothetical protein
MGPEYLRRLLLEHGRDLAAKAYLFADPFRLPKSLDDDKYLVYDPSFDDLPVETLVREFSWFRERVRQIHDALHSNSASLIPAARYLEKLKD